MSGTTIVAPATAAGRAAVGILRLSGPAATRVAQTLTGRPLPPPRIAAVRLFRDPADGQAIDRGLLVWFAAPASFTGEDVVELQHHGSTGVQRALLRACLAAAPGVEPAAPGAFTRRAFANGRLDLSQVEALADLIDATTAVQARQAVRQLDGELGRRCRGWSDRLLSALAMAEAEIDFAPDQDLPAGLIDGVLPDAEAVRAEIVAALGSAGHGQRLRDGLVVAVVGAPNAGKSSLVNRLARREAALVTPHAGTTRDVIEVQLDLVGLPVTLLDTAGLRDATDPVERLGIDLARRRAEAADLRLLVLDATAPERPPAAEPVLIVANKADLAPPPPGIPAISCRSGAGLDTLEAVLADRAAALLGDGSAVVTAERHRLALAEAADALGRLASVASADLRAEELRLAVAALGRITGTVGTEAVLERIFARFCIGK
ncbi:MAG: tRNA uridine-5-carboxymethylaminomethyl(34) synthesis GTPase MnmE [Geminicoccaceae bacterium]